MNDPTPAPRTRIFPFLLAATAAFVLLFRLGARDFENKDTLWYVEIAWEMLRSGDWVVPRFNGVIFTEKPILFIWLVAGAAKLFGGLTPFVARLPSALAATGCVALTASLGRRLFGARAGILAGFVLCTGYAFAWEARTCMVDMTFSFFTTLTLFFLYLGEREDGRRAGPFLLAYAAAGLAALTKGPLGLGFPAIVFLAYLAWARRLRLVRRMRLPWGVVIVAALQAAWYLPYLVRIGPDGRAFFWEMYVVKENLLRLTTGFDKPEPFWFYLPEIAGHFLPWSVFLLLVPWAPPPARDRRFPAAWFLAVFAFLTLSSGKHSRYALPLYPAAALLVGDYWDRLIAAPAPACGGSSPPPSASSHARRRSGSRSRPSSSSPFPWRSLAAAAAPRPPRSPCGASTPRGGCPRRSRRSWSPSRRGGPSSSRAFRCATRGAPITGGSRNRSPRRWGRRGSPPTVSSAGDWRSASSRGASWSISAPRSTATRNVSPPTSPPRAGLLPSGHRRIRGPGWNAPRTRWRRRSTGTRNSISS